MTENKYNIREAVHEYPRFLAIDGKNYWRDKTGAIRRVHPKPITGRAKRRLNRIKFKAEGR